MTFGERIKYLGKEKGLTLLELSHELNKQHPPDGVRKLFTSTTLTSWENNRANPTARNVLKLAIYFDVSMNYLLGLEATKVPPGLCSREYTIPFYGKLSFGLFEEVSNKVKKLKIPKTAFGEINPEECFCLEVNIDSMNKALAICSKIIVHDYRNMNDFKINTGDILVMKQGLEYTIKRIRRTETRIHLEPDSYFNEFTTNVISVKHFDDIKVIGKVIYSFQKF